MKVAATTSNGSDTLFGIRISGDVVGELAALRDGNRTATITTCTATITHAIPHAAFVGFLNRHVDAWEALCRMIADRLDWANRRRLDFGGYDVPTRLARVLLELVEQHGFAIPGGGHDLGVRLSQHELGTLIGAKEDAIGLAMRQLRTKHLVKSNYRKVMINNLGGLREFADRG